MAACCRDLKYRAPSELIASGYKRRSSAQLGRLCSGHHFIFNGGSPCHRVTTHSQSSRQALRRKRSARPASGICLSARRRKPHGRHSRRVVWRCLDRQRFRPRCAAARRSERAGACRRDDIQRQYRRARRRGSASSVNLRAPQANGSTDPASITLLSSSPVSTASTSWLFSDSFSGNWGPRLTGIDQVPLIFVDPGQRPAREAQRAFDRDLAQRDAGLRDQWGEVRCSERRNQVSRFSR